MLVFLVPVNVKYLTLLFFFLIFLDLVILMLFLYFSCDEVFNQHLVYVIAMFISVRCKSDMHKKVEDNELYLFTFSEFCLQHYQLPLAVFCLK